MTVRRFSYCIIAFFLLCAFFPTKGQLQPQQPRQEGGDSKFIYYTGDHVQSVPNMPEAFYMRGDAVVYRDGTVITCDSAVSYSETHFEFFGRVVINKNTTYVYGDRAEYNGDQNLATIYAPIIKMVDGDAVLYTYNFTFNTLDNVGHYFGGATMQQGDNFMESNEGYYYVDTREMVGVSEVEMRNPDYKLRSDSVLYNMNTEVASFFTPTYIWNSRGEILSASRGSYNNALSLYEFKADSYVITDTREIWADTIDYNSVSEDAWMYGNIQIRDEEQNVMAFGDHARFWGERSDALLTRDPSLMSYDPGQPDTLYVRSDSMFLYTLDKNAELTGDGSLQQTPAVDMGEERIMPGSRPGRGRGDGLVADQLPAQPVSGQGDSELPIGEAVVGHDHDHDHIEEASPDSLAVVAPALSDKELRRMEKDREQARKNEEKRLEKEAKDAAKKARQAEKDAEKLAKRQARGKDSDVVRDAPQVVAIDSTQMIAMADSLALADSLAAASLLAPESIEPQEEDSLQRVFKAYHDVRIYRTDIQAVCDSMVGLSKDTTMHLYIDPVMWSGNSQIASDVMDLYTRNDELYKALYTGDPMMTSEVELGKYNQVKGITMEALFRDNDIYFYEVNRNAQTLYYIQDDDTRDLMGFMSVTAARAAFNIDSQRIVRMAYYNQVDDKLYPMDQIPPEQILLLEGFAWHANRRPTIDSVFNRTIRPSVRTQYESMPQPGFPLTDIMIRDKERKIRDGVWTERNDKLTTKTIDYIRSVDPDFGKEPEEGRRSSGGSEITITDSLPAPADSLQAEEPVVDAPEEGKTEAEGVVMEIPVDGEASAEIVSPDPGEKQSEELQDNTQTQTQIDATLREEEIIVTGQEEEVIVPQEEVAGQEEPMWQLSHEDEEVDPVAE